MHCESRCRELEGNWPRGKFGINKQAALQHEGGKAPKKIKKIKKQNKKRRQCSTREARTQKQADFEEKSQSRFFSTTVR